MDADKKAKILAGLEKLDPKLDSQWADDGTPRIEAVRMATGLFDLQREEVTEASPYFTRVNTAGTPPGQQSTATELVGETQAAAVLTATTPVPTPPVAPIQQEKPQDEPSLEELLEKERDLLSRMRDARDDLINKIMVQERVIMNLESQIPRETMPEHKKSQEAIQGYLKQQRANLQDRAAKIERFKDLDLSQLPRRAPIDEARMQRRRRN